jgi:4-diphosphocytidyl-2-C-methyl-D-erythritol kinase
MSLTVLRETAYAKVNLTLDVLEKRADGYHDLRSVMQTISLCDELEITLGTGAWSVSCADAAVPTGEDNLILRAARAYCEAASVEPNGVQVALTKRIPMQAGLGGGSADAAAMLRALNRHDQKLTMEQLCTVAEQVGADVPFCVVGGTRLCEGKGERMTALPSLPACWFVVCKPEFSIATPALFRQLDEHPQLRASGVPMAEAALLEGKLPEGVLTNRFECLLEQMHPEIPHLREVLLAHGACLASLSGTGSAYFGLFEEESSARAAQAALQAEFPQVFLAQPV